MVGEWEKEGFFPPELTDEGQVKDAGSFVIVPPLNITGNIHMSHALGNSLQDIMIDHASISTQSVVENMLWRRQGKTQYNLGRIKFIETVWKWEEEYH